jgi:quinol monooxygenase YgiN
MLTVQIEHPVPEYDKWRAAFVRDPANREASGVRRYRVYRPVDDAHFVIVELDFDDRDRAESFVTTMRGIWKQVEGTVMTGPQVRILECLDEHQY